LILFNQRETGMKKLNHFYTGLGAVVGAVLCVRAAAGAAIGGTIGQIELSCMDKLTCIKSPTCSGLYAQCCPTGKTATKKTCPTGWLASGTTCTRAATTGSDDKGYYQQTYGTCAAETSAPYDCYEVGPSGALGLGCAWCMNAILPAQ